MRRRNSLRTVGAESRCPERPEPKPKGLLERSSDLSKVTRIKTSNALWKRSAKWVLRRSSFSSEIVEPRCRARNRRWRKSHQKNYLTASVLSSPNSLNLFKLGADRRQTPRRASSEYKLGGSNVYMREPPTPCQRTRFGVFKQEKQKRCSEKSQRRFCFFHFPPGNAGALACVGSASPETRHYRTRPSRPCLRGFCGTNNRCAIVDLNFPIALRRKRQRRCRRGPCVPRALLIASANSRI